MGKVRRISNVTKTLKERDSDTTSACQIQSFLTTQISPFVLGKFGTITDGACLCLSRLLADNSYKGISPALCSALSIVGRSQFIISAMPFIIEAVSILIRYRYNQGIINHILLYENILYLFR